MQIETFSHRLRRGLVGRLPDRARFGANAGPGLRRDRLRRSAPQALAELAAAFPESAHRRLLERRRDPFASRRRRHAGGRDRPVRADRARDRRRPGSRRRATRSPRARGSGTTARAAMRRSSSSSFPMAWRSTAPISCGVCRDSLPQGTMICGGLAADGDRFARTWVLVDGQAASSGMSSARWRFPARSRSARGRRAAGTRSGPSARSRARRATSSSSSTASRRSRCTRNIWAISLPACPRRRCASRCRSARTASARTSVVRTILADRRGDAVDDLRGRHPERLDARS